MNVNSEKLNKIINFEQAEASEILISIQNLLTMSDTDEQLDNQVHIFLKALYYLSEKMGATLTKGEQEYAFAFKQELNKLYNLNIS